MDKIQNNHVNPVNPVQNKPVQKKPCGTGSAFLTEPVPLGPATSFQAHLVLGTSELEPDSGLAFVIHSGPRGPVELGLPSGLGYFTIPKSLAIALRAGGKLELLRDGALEPVATAAWPAGYRHLWVKYYRAYA